MTTQDIYSWVQIGLQVLVGGGLVAGIYRYFGVLKRAIEGQEKTIAAQAEQMKAQSTVLQDFERLNKLMQQVIDVVDPEAQLKREQAYRARADRDMDDLRHEMSQRAQKLGQYVEEMQKRLVVDIVEMITTGLWADDAPLYHSAVSLSWATTGTHR
jgi:hypothetical protein